jgi:hypothetical protein
MQSANARQIVVIVTANCVKSELSIHSYSTFTYIENDILKSSDITSNYLEQGPSRAANSRSPSVHKMPPLAPFLARQYFISHSFRIHFGAILSSKRILPGSHFPSDLPTKCTSLSFLTFVMYAMPVASSLL